jgi:hypothetical protein
MKASPNPQIAAEAARASTAQHLIETRKAYERSKIALAASMTAVERSFDAMGKGATAINRKVMDIAKRNIDTGFDLAKSLAGARDLSEMVELQAAHWRKQFGVLSDQAEEVRSLSAQVAADAGQRVQS